MNFELLSSIIYFISLDAKSGLIGTIVRPQKRPAKYNIKNSEEL